MEARNKEKYGSKKEGIVWKQEKKEKYGSRNKQVKLPTHKSANLIEKPWLEA